MGPNLGYLLKSFLLYLANSISKSKVFKTELFHKRKKKIQELWSFLHFRWLHFCHPPFSRLSTYSWPPRLRHRIYELSICRFHNYNHWMWHLQGQKRRRLYLQSKQLPLSCRLFNPNWHEGWYFYLLVIFGSDFVSWFFIKTFQTFWRWKFISIGLFWHPAQLIESFKSCP